MSPSVASRFAASSFFPLARAAREKYAFFAPSFADFMAARELAAKINTTRDLENNPELAVKSGRLAAAALLDEIFAAVIEQYAAQVEAGALEEAPSFLDENVGQVETATLFEVLDREFAPPATSLQSRPDALEFLLRLHLANSNPALGTFSELFDSSPLNQTKYAEAMEALGAYFAALPTFGPDELDLMSLLMRPLKEHPNSVEAQLRFVMEQWGERIVSLAPRLLLHLDLIREEEKPVFFGPGPAQVLTFGPGADDGGDGQGYSGGSLYGGQGLVGLEEYEAFSEDTSWMPKMVLLAKQTYVWLDQLSKKFGRHIARLDEVPDEELDEMASRGITGLWLIGVWERSPASQRIKRMTGNPDAIASAYSLKSYEVAVELGGWDAMENLKSRALSRGIRMASDMVPNHTGLDSDWMMEHPDWFLSLDFPPFPNSTFDGANLSDDERMGIFLENGYYSKTDASVVFRRLDPASGQNRYIYHGNDGTLMPWNDTAQLNYLIPEVREAVIQTILAVARHFPIIRFDAAMTLAKRHIHRLWFPAPGSGGDIPSRSGRGMSAAQFDAAMPREFWREVVDRVATEVPGTLLLAEAFWLMEGYFVRTLGMHRVYNSAFMNMLRDEENASYRLIIKNTLEFDRDILERFVNFMNNPDEDTAADRFGKGDKYFSVATMLATLPGLPMWGHGQIEGLREKYGMEYPRAYWDEKPDAGFIKYHEEVIFPLLRRRELFAGSENFYLFDVWNADGYVDEDIYAYSNQLGEERTLVIFNNRNAKASGWIHLSSAFADKQTGELKQRSLGDVLGLSPHGNSFAIFRDNTTKLEYIRSSRDVCEKGLYIELNAYGSQVFWNLREVRDDAGLYARLAERLNGAGVPSVDRALRELLLEPLDAPFRDLCDVELWQALLPAEFSEDSEEEDVVDASHSKVEVAEPETGRFIEEENEEAIPSFSAEEARVELEQRLRTFARAANSFMDVSGEVEAFVEPTMQLVERALNVEDSKRRPFWLGYALLAELGQLNQAVSVRAQSRLWADEWLLCDMIEATWSKLGLEHAGWLNELRIALAAASNSEGTTPLAFLNTVLGDDATRLLLNINTFGQTIWFNEEGSTRLGELLHETAEFENAQWPLETLDMAREAANFRLVRWMEGVRGAVMNGKGENG